jgi:hypothetical protein
MQSKTQSKKMQFLQEFRSFIVNGKAAGEPAG